MQGYIINLNKVKDEANQAAGFIVLCTFNVLATATILVILHPYMALDTGLFFLTSFVGGGVILFISCLPYHSKLSLKDKPQ